MLFPSVFLEKKRSSFFEVSASFSPFLSSEEKEGFIKEKKKKKEGHCGSEVEV